jgi:hypothetical protein
MNKLSGEPELTDLRLSKKANRLGLLELRGWFSRLNLKKAAPLITERCDNDSLQK